MGPGDVADFAADFADTDRREGDFNGCVRGVVGVKRHGRVHCPCVEGVVDHDVFACAFCDVKAAQGAVDRENVVGEINRADDRRAIATLESARIWLLIWPMAVVSNANIMGVHSNCT